MKKFLLTLIILLAPSLAWAQCNGVFPPGTYCGNSTASPNVPSATPGANAFAPRLQANTTFYVRTDGNDSNTCLSNTPTTACLTIQAALTKVQGYDLNGFAVVISVADGAYSAGVLCDSAFIGNYNSAGVTITGNVTTPSNVTITNSTGELFQLLHGCNLTIQGFKGIQNAAGGDIIWVAFNGYLSLTNFEFGAVASGFHLNVFQLGIVQITGPTTISGGAQAHYHVSQSGVLIDSTNTVTCSGAPAFSSFFAGVSSANLQAIGTTYSGCGSVTGQRYLVHNNGFIDLGNSGASPTYFPGNVAGITELYGVYDYTTPGNLALGGRLQIGTTAPTINSCSTGTVANGSTDQTGQATSTGATTCAINFTSAFTVAPFCVASDASRAAALQVVATASVLTISGQTAGDVISWICFPKVGGL